MNIPLKFKVCVFGSLLCLAIAVCCAAFGFYDNHFRILNFLFGSVIFLGVIGLVFAEQTTPLKDRMTIKGNINGVTMFGTIIVMIGTFLLFYHIFIIDRFNHIFHPAELLYFSVYVILDVTGIFIIRRKNRARILFLCLIWAWFIFISYIVYLIIRYHPFMLPKRWHLKDILFGYFSFGILPFLISIYFFTRPKVKEQFK